LGRGLFGGEGRFDRLSTAAARDEVAFDTGLFPGCQGMIDESSENLATRTVRRHDNRPVFCRTRGLAEDVAYDVGPAIRTGGDQAA